MGSAQWGWGSCGPKGAPFPSTQRPHLELSSRDSACGTEVQRHHHGEPGGAAAMASGHRAKGPEDSEGGSNLLHCGGMGQNVTCGLCTTTPTSHLSPLTGSPPFFTGSRPRWVPCHLLNSTPNHTHFNVSHILAASGSAGGPRLNQEGIWGPPGPDGAWEEGRALASSDVLSGSPHHSGLKKPCSLPTTIH